MSDQPYLGEIQVFPYTFAPRYWAYCDGQLLSIAQNAALFSLLGTTYGGNGSTTFALPDLRGRAPMHVGGGHVLGEASGAESITLSTGQLPVHSHTVDVTPLTLTARCRNAAGDQRTPVGSTAANSSDAAYTQAAADSNMAGSSIAIGGTMTAANAGSGTAHDNRQPYLAMAYCIALQGVFPSQS